MASNVFTTAGTTFAVSANEPATYDSTGFAALTYTTVAEVTDAGEYGPQYEIVTHQPIGSRALVKRKGSVDYGEMTWQLGRDPSNAGQTILIAGTDGAQVDQVHSFKITLQDGTIQYFTGVIASYSTALGAANTIVGAAVTVALDNKIIEV